MSYTTIKDNGSLPPPYPTISPQSETIPQDSSQLLQGRKITEGVPTEQEPEATATKKAAAAGQEMLSGKSTEDETSKIRITPAIEPLPGSSATQTTESEHPVDSVLSQLHLVASIFAYLEGNDAAQGSQACHAFHNGRHLADIQRVRDAAAIWGIVDLSFSVDPVTGLRLTDSDKLPAIIDKLKAINCSLPETLRSKNSIEDFALNPSWILGFFQRAYDCQVVAAFSKAVRIDKQNPLASQLHIIFEWLAITQARWLFANKQSLLLLPLEIFQLTHLQLLSVSNNQLETIPSQIDQLTALQVFDASQNRLKELPLQIGLLKELIGIDVSYNQLETLPKSLFQLPNLRQIDARGNPKLVVPEAWVKKFREKGGEFLQ
jgi:hypothetical protein